MAWFATKWNGKAGVEWRASDSKQRRESAGMDGAVKGGTETDWQAWKGLRVVQGFGKGRQEGQGPSWTGSG